MTLRTGTLLSGIVGGVAWLLRGVLDTAGSIAGSGDGLGDVLYWVGLVLLAVALAGFGAGLVTATWLRGIVAVGLPLLVWSVLEVTDPGTGPAMLDALLGLVVAATSAKALRHEVPELHSHHRGAHAR